MVQENLHICIHEVTAGLMKQALKQKSVAPLADLREQGRSFIRIMRRYLRLL